MPKSMAPTVTATVRDRALLSIDSGVDCKPKGGGRNAFLELFGGRANCMVWRKNQDDPPVVYSLLLAQQDVHEVIATILRQ